MMNEKPLVSIIIPVYNAEIYLEKCLNSVVEQTLKDIEIILVNDGSSDNSKEICEKYKYNDKRVVLIDKDNSGVSDTRNRGIKVANADYLVFLDSDDFIDSNYCEVLYKIISKSDYGLVICGAKLHEKDKTTSIFLDDFCELNENNVCDSDFLFSFFIENNSFGGIISKIYRLRFLVDNNISFNEKIKN